VEGNRDSQEECLEKEGFRIENEHEGEKGGNKNPKTMPPTSVMTRLILIMVWRKLIRNPNTYSSLIGLTWSLISFRYVSSFLNIFVLMLHLLIVIIVFV